LALRVKLGVLHGDGQMLGHGREQADVVVRIGVDL